MAVTIAAGMITVRESFKNGNGDSKSINEPRTIDIIPPIVSIPYDMTFTSSMKRIRPMIISKSPA